MCYKNGAERGSSLYGDDLTGYTTDAESQGSL